MDWFFSVPTWHVMYKPSEAQDKASLAMQSAMAMWTYTWKPPCVHAKVELCSRHVKKNPAATTQELSFTAEADSVIEERH